MKRIKKKDLLEMLKTLEEANDLIGNRHGNSMAGTADTLAQCQEAALVIGNYLESQGEKGVAIVRILEKYCENIYQISLVLEDEAQCRKIAKKIRKELIDVKNCIRYDLPDDKREIVFLPYKASMWDSLESIWKKAVEDDSCETYVVPIPYFDKNPDGSMGQMHYEGGEYPNDVPIIFWEEYSLIDRRPDIVFIHNPYDENNYVTSVHPAFYAKELKKHTDMLIYIPYFVCVNDIVRDEFCMQPGVAYADKVILQSEKVREAYIRIYHQWEDMMGFRNQLGKAEEKFLALGSPKFDKVAAVKKEDFVIPIEWKRLIERSDGTSKKVILYNTSIANILKYGEKTLEKVKDVLRIFYCQKNVVLLWRPHPLLRSTLQALRREFVQDYDDIVKSYIKEGWGIYDDTADMYRAIAVSDAYFGDGSSVAELYKRTGKPVMIQNVNIIYKEGPDS